MVHSRSCAVLFLSLFASLSHATARLMPSVLRTLDRLEACVESGRWAEADAVAPLVSVKGSVSYSVDGDPTIAREAMDRWEDALEGRVRFEPGDWNTAQLRLRIGMGASCGPEHIGLALVTRRVTLWSGGQFTTTFNGSLQVSDRDPFGRPLGREAQIQATLHELGHFLGLDDSYRVGDLMGPLDPHRPVARPSREEALTLTELSDRAGMLMTQACLVTQDR